ncbi:MAG: hypothetical protein KJ065_03150 [Anaerolineae bacterium]|nr:hypothetical protein [Anaerolineae bacterium]
MSAEVETVKQFYGIFRSLREEYKKNIASRARKHLSEMEKARHDDYLYKYIEWKYQNEPLLKRCGVVYPVAVFPAPKHQRHNLNSVLLDLKSDSSSPDDGFVVDNSEFLSKLQAIAVSEERVLFRGETYTMSKLEVPENGSADSIGIHCGIGDYFKLLRTCRSLEWELLRTWHKQRHKPSTDKEFAEFDRKLHLRTKLHQQVLRPTIDGSGRSAAISTSTAIIYQDDRDNQFYFLALLRSEEVATCPNMLHVLPSGIFQPTTKLTVEEFETGGIEYNVYREYLEELFGRKEPGESGQNRHYRSIEGDICLQFLFDLMQEGKAQLLFTGVAIDLHDLQPEVCTVLIVRTPEWFRRHSRSSQSDSFTFNWEFDIQKRLEDGPPRNVPQIRRIPYGEDDESMLSTGNLYPQYLTAQGAAAFWLGVDVLRDEDLLKPL